MKMQEIIAVLGSTDEVLAAELTAQARRQPSSRRLGHG